MSPSDQIPPEETISETMPDELGSQEIVAEETMPLGAYAADQGQFDTFLPSEPSGPVRHPLPHDSAHKHVTGGAAYIDDLPEPEGTLHIAPGYSKDGVAGMIMNMDLREVRRAKGVIHVLTAYDVPGENDCSASIGGDPVFADGRVEFHGQVVFAVIADTHLNARKAAKLASISVINESPAITVAEAMEQGDVVLDDYEFLRGDPESAFAGSANVVAGMMNIGGQEHFYLETQAAMAHPGEDGDILVQSSTQHPSEIQHVIARVLGEPMAKVTVEVRRMGGGFGGKESQANQWACIAALAARKTGRTCKIRLDRDDDMIMTGKRHDFRVYYKAGIDEHGVIQAFDTDQFARCGYSADLSLGVCDRTMFHADNAYYYPAVHIRSHRLKSNTCSNTAFRGFGGPQGIVAAERAMDAIAIEMGIDPLEIRKRNFYGKKTRNITPYGMTIEDNIIAEVVGKLEADAEYGARRRAIAEFNARSGILKKGLSLVPLKFGISFTLPHLNQAGALVHVYNDGSVHLNHGGTEMGQGLFIKVAQVVAQVFGISIDRVKITATHTGKVPNTSPTAASSGSDLNGMAAQIAAQTIKDRMIEFAAEYYEADPDRIEFRDDMVFLDNKTIAFDQLAKEAYLARVALSSTGFYATPKITWNRDEATGRPFYYFVYGAACAEVTIDTMTGEMIVDRVDILHDVGQSINPAIDIGQIEGGFIQGMGWLTTEELVWNAEGRLMTHAPSTYKIPTASDLPKDFRVTLYASENTEKTVYRSKAVGEPPLMLATCVFSAITDAVASLSPGRVPALDAPATPEAIIRAVHGMKAGA